ncbi:MAG: hypothetical protein Q8O64_14255 [Sideroxyarcus sp.]|nr:hypothetical protein [Sideroxyarcus sp.]
MHPLIQSWLLQAAAIFLVIGILAGLLVGALLVLCPHRLQRIIAPLDRWISTRNFDKELERNFSLDPWLYRYRSITGTLILLGALFVLYYFIAVLDRGLAIAGLARHFAYPATAVAALLDALVLVSLVGALCAVLVALFMLFRPSLLRGFEQGANQWLSLRRSLKPLEIPRNDVDVYVLRYARQAGILLILGGLYTLVLLLIWMSGSV